MFSSNGQAMGCRVCYYSPLMLECYQFATPCGTSGIREAKKALKKTQAVQRIGGCTVGTGTANMEG